MVNVPWRHGKREDTDSDSTDPPEDTPLISCEFQDGTLAVYEDYLQITRPARSQFSDKQIDLTEVRDVTYAKRFIISYIQIDQVDFASSEKGFLTTPVDENTLHFGHGKRECATKARDAILEQLTDG